MRKMELKYNPLTGDVDVKRGESPVDKAYKQMWDAEVAVSTGYDESMQQRLEAQYDEIMEKVKFAPLEDSVSGYRNWNASVFTVSPECIRTAVHQLNSQQMANAYKTLSDTMADGALDYTWKERKPDVNSIDKKRVKFRLPIPDELLRETYYSERFSDSSGQDDYQTVVYNHLNARSPFRSEFEGSYGKMEKPDELWEHRNRECSLYHAFHLHLRAAEVAVSDREGWLQHSPNEELRKYAEETLPHWRWYVFTLKQSLIPHYGNEEERAKYNEATYVAEENG